ncbi:hypothetical protein, partial [Escherichia coli]|uniref:hypothetical protein n=1 Tax=Escherichia coli TaxID=562 RepID=UPI001BB10872
IMGISSPIFRCMNIGDELKLRSCVVVMNQQAYNGYPPVRSSSLRLSCLRARSPVFRCSV